MSLTQARRSDPVMTAPALRDAGRPLDTATRSGFESGFGRDFSNVRVHDDAHAHDSARALDARAYAAGDHIVFGRGEYQPDTAVGRALLAHELAHTVQQAGVAMKANGPLPASSDARIEAEADRAAADVMSGRGAPALSRINRPAVFRAQTGTSTPTPTVASTPGAKPANYAPGFSVDTDNPAVANANDITVWLDQFTLPQPKGAGAWVQPAYDEAAAGKRLGISLLLSSGAAYKEDSASDEYMTAWLNRHGFKGLGEMALAINQAAKSTTAPLVVPPDVTALLGLVKKGKVSELKCDIDHIVEKQMGGTSQPSNLQILTGTVNQASGREAYAELKRIAQSFIDFSPDWKNVARITMRIRAATVKPGVDDASVQLERLLRANPQLGNAKTKAAAGHNPLYLTAGGVGETIAVKGTGETEVDEAGLRIVPGVKLRKYQRAATKTLPDTVTGDLDNRAMQQSGAGGKGIEFKANNPPAVAAAAVSAPTAAAPAATAAPVAASVPANTEHRELKLNKTGFKELKFFYPYLSPGVVKTIDIDSQGRLTGTGQIMPSVQFLGNLDFKFGPDELTLTKKLDVAALNGSAMMQRLKSNFRFTESSLDLDLMKFVPSGNLAFTAGPADKPIVTGSAKASVEGGALIVTGDLKAGDIPGITAADGKITYSSKTGWSGMVKASSSKFPGATKVDVTLGMREGPNGLQFYGEGGVTTKVRDSDLVLGASWKGSTIGYYGKVTIPKPLPLVDSVELGGTYQQSTLVLTGTVKGFTWKNKFQGDLTVKYVKKDGEDGKFSGTVDAKTIGDTSKMDGHINLTLQENGKISGLGEVSYQVTKDLRPKLGVQLIADPHYRVRLFGDLNVATIPLTGEWPKKGGEKKEIIKGLGIKIPIPTPIPLLTAYFEARGSFGVTYGIGPLALNNVKFNGELWPLEDDPKIKASLTGRLSAPGFAGIYGTFGARLGAEVAQGALGLNGGIDVTPSLKLIIDAGVDVNASYSAEKGFAFGAEASVDTVLMAQIAFDLKASIYGAYGLLEYTWTHPLNDPKPKQLGPKFKVTLGKIAYSKDQGIVWPSLDQIDYSPKDFDPKSIISDLLSETKPQKQ